MFSRWIVTNIISARGALHCRKTRIHFGDQLVICGLYIALNGRRLMINDGFESIWKEPVMCFKLSSLHLSGGAGDNHERHR
jgi:hypothetical protein